MNTKHVKGSFNETKGKIKENVGHAIGDDKLASEGVVDRVKGTFQKGLGDVKDAVKKGVDTVLEKINDRRSA